VSIWSHLFPQRTFDDTRFRRLFSDLLQLALDFLAYQQYKNAIALNRILLLRSLTSPSLEKHFNGTVKQAKIDLEKQELKDTDFHYLNYLLNRSQHERQEHIALKLISGKFLERADYHLECFYLSKKLEHYSDAKRFSDITAQELEIHLPSELFTYLDKSPCKDELSIQAWLATIQMNENPEEEKHFFQLKNMVLENGNFLQKGTQKTLLVHLMNYCIDTKIHKGKSSYYHELLELYQTGLSSKVIFENDKLPLQQYKNIIALSLHLKQFEWAEDFIKSYTENLPKNEQDNALNFNLANVYFHQGKFNQAIELLRDVKLDKIEYAIGSRLMLLQTYFELEEINALDSLLDSFKIYVRRSKLITKDTKQRCLNIIRFTKKLTQLAPYDKVKRENLYEQISNCKNVGLKPWLLEKCLPNKGA